jgi:hypothetical protein
MVLNVAEIYLLAAVVLLVAIFLLYVALGFYQDCITRIVKCVGVFGAIRDWSQLKENRDKWWKNWVGFDMGSWLRRNDRRD